MDPVSDLIADNKIPIGQWVKTLSDIIVDNYRFILRGIAESVSRGIDSFANFLAGLPPVVLILIIAGIAYYLQRSKVLALGVALGLAFALNQGMWKQTVATFVLVVLAAALSMLVGVPIGIWAAHRPKVYRVLQPVLDLMQTLPTFVYLIPVMALFGLRQAPALIVTVLFVAPTAVRMTHLGITNVSKAIVEAGESFGATKRQLLWKVELPAALPTIMTGLTQCIMLSLSMVVVAALIGAGGLGGEVVNALNRGPLGIPRGVEAGLSIVILAIILDRMTRIGSGGKK